MQLCKSMPLLSSLHRYGPGDHREDIVTSDQVRPDTRSLSPFQDAVSDRELCGTLRIKLDKMKTECDKMAAQLSKKTQAHALLQRKYRLLKEEVEENVSPALPRVDVKKIVFHEKTFGYATEQVHFQSRETPNQGLNITKSPLFFIQPS